MSVSLGQIATRLGARVIADDPTAATREVFDVVHQSQTSRPGALFVAVSGAVHDGHDHVGEAARNGAVAAVVERVVDAPLPLLVVADSRAALGPAASLTHGEPSRRLALIGVTGTNGKTTVVTFVGQLLEQLAQPTRVIGTLTGPRTTPEATDLQRQLRTFADAGIEVVAMEVSSHALALHRVDGCEFRVAVFTNLGRDHLDFHGTQERYFEAKARLFEQGRAQLAILNTGDVHGRLLRDVAEIPVVSVDLDALDEVEYSVGHTSFVWREQAVRLSVPGPFNVVNALLAGEVAVALGHPSERIAAAMGHLTAPPGRLERVSGGSIVDPVVFVDYAHTPDALEAVLGALRSSLGDQGRLIVVAGCGGDRDRNKRPEMGRVAASRADEAWFTSDNPRSEDPAVIMEAMVAGVLPDDRAGVRIELDRRTAIFRAIHRAAPNDVVLVAGKGHEATQTTGGVSVPFDDRVVASQALATRAIAEDSAE